MKKRNTRRCSAEQATNTNLLKDLLSSVIALYSLRHDSRHCVTVTDARCFCRNNSRSRARIDKQRYEKQDEDVSPPHKFAFLLLWFPKWNLGLFLQERLPA